MGDLIARLEAATGASGELDNLIGEAVGIRFRSRRTSGGKNKGREWFVDSYGGVETWAHHPPAYTASIDSAMTLVPEDARISNFSQHDHALLRERGEWMCILYRHGLLGTLSRETFEWRCHHAPTPALALCIAALRARQAAK